MSLTPSARSFATSLRSLSKRALAPGEEAGDPVADREPAIAQFRRTLGATLRQVPRPTAGLVFVSGVPSPAPLIAKAAAEVAKGIELLVVPSAGILTENGEVEGVLAAAGIVWSGGSARAMVADDAAGLAAAVDAERPPPALLTFHAADGFEPADVRAVARARCVFGAGSPGTTVWVVRRGLVAAGRIAAMRLDGAAPVVEASLACKLVTDPMVVTEMDRGIVVRLEGEPALDVLSAKAGGGRFGGLVLVSLHDHADPSRYVVRSLRGIDPGRRGFLVAGDVEVGDSLSFAVRDADAARAGLGEAARRAEQQILGSAPTFAIYLSCAGRGRALYGAPDGDVRILKKRFPRLPIAGMHSAFEIVPWGPEDARMQLMSGVVALFRAPS